MPIQLAMIYFGENSINDVFVTEIAIGFDLDQFESTFRLLSDNTLTK